MKRSNLSQIWTRQREAIQSTIQRFKHKNTKNNHLYPQENYKLCKRPDM